MSKQLLGRFPKHEVGFSYCTNEKIFTVTLHEHAKRSSVRFLHS